MTGDFLKLANHVERQRKAYPVYVRELQRAGLLFLKPDRLVTAEITETLRASEDFFEGSPDGLNLPYQEGHVPQGDAEVDAVIAAVGDFGVVGVANDARSPGGFPYGIVIENRDGTHAAAAAELPAVLEAAAPEAWEKGQKAAR